MRTNALATMIVLGLLQAAPSMAGQGHSAPHEPAAAVQADAKGEAKEPMLLLLVVRQVQVGSITVFEPNVEILVVASGGHLVSLGLTDADGALRVDKRLVSPDATPVVLACPPGTGCAAIRTREEDLDRFDEYVVTVASSVIF